MVVDRLKIDLKIQNDKVDMDFLDSKDIGVYEKNVDIANDIIT